MLTEIRFDTTGIVRRDLETMKEVGVAFPPIDVFDSDFEPKASDTLWAYGADWILGQYHFEARCEGPGTNQTGYGVVRVFVAKPEDPAQVVKAAIGGKNATA